MIPNTPRKIPKYPKYSKNTFTEWLPCMYASMSLIKNCFFLNIFIGIYKKQSARRDFRFSISRTPE